jgi:hypothetical protein
MATDITLSDGSKWTILTIPFLVIERIYTSRDGEPQPPKVEVTFAGGKKSVELNRNDPAYLAAHEAWERNKNAKTVHDLLLLGVADQPAPGEVDSLSMVFPEANSEELRYLWMAGRLQNPDILIELTNAIVSQTAPTAEGLKEVEAQFPNSG